MLLAKGNAAFIFLQNYFILSVICPSDQNNATFAHTKLQLHLCKCLNTSVRYQNHLQLHLFMSGLKLLLLFRNTTVIQALASSYIEDIVLLSFLGIRVQMPPKSVYSGNCCFFFFFFKQQFHSPRGKCILYFERNTFLLSKLWKHRTSISR